jgi:hypothetical protein
MTRAPLVRAGGLFLGSAGAHADATDAALFEMLAGRKRLGNPDLWCGAAAAGTRGVSRGLCGVCGDLMLSWCV